MMFINWKNKIFEEKRKYLYIIKDKEPIVLERKQSGKHCQVTVFQRKGLCYFEWEAEQELSNNMLQNMQTA